MLLLGYLQYAQEFMLQLLDQERSTVLAPVPHCQQRGQVVMRGQKEIFKKEMFPRQLSLLQQQAGKGNGGGRTHSAPNTKAEN